MLSEKMALPEDRHFQDILRNYQDLLDNTNDAVITCDPEDTIISWNRGAEIIFGWKAGEITGKKLLPLLVPPRMQAEAMSLIRDAISGRAVAGINTVRLHRDGTTGINVDLAVFPARGADRNVTGLTYVIRDLSERKRAEELRFKIMRLERLAEEKKAKELHLENTRFTLTSRAEQDFLTSMSHELRTPLNSIIGFSELMKQGVQSNLNDKQKQYVEHILSSGRYLLEFIDNLDLRVLEPGKIQLVIGKMPVAETIGEVFALLKERAEKQNVTMKKDIDSLIDFIEADHRMFKQILFNLMNNAVKFSKKEGGTVTVTAKRTGDTMRFSVTDTGIGIMGGDMARIFNKGTGLTVSKKLVELHGGTLTIESRYGEGSTFAFQIPVTAVKGPGK